VTSSRNSRTDRTYGRRGFFHTSLAAAGVAAGGGLLQVATASQASAAPLAGSAIVLSAANDGSSSVQRQLIDAARAAVQASVPVVVPPGDYLIDDAPMLPHGLNLIGPGARFFGYRPGGNILWVGDDSVIDGITVQNTDSSSGNIGLHVYGSRVSITHCKFVGSSSTQAVYLSRSGCSDIKIVDNVFTGVNYGVLSNSFDGDGAYDLHDVVISGNTFTDIYADAIELNHPSSSAPLAHGFTISGNVISVPVGRGSGRGSGFGVGVAGCADVTVTGNTFLEVRQEAVHVEDGCRRVTITGNTVSGVTGADASAGIAIYPSCEEVTITGNSVENIAGAGIQLIYNGEPAMASDVAITGNTVRDVTDTGIVVGSDSGRGGGYLISGNIIRGARNHGVQVFGTLEDISVTDNLITECGGYGVATERNGGTAARIRYYRDNLINRCGLGDYQAVPIWTGNAVVVPERTAVVAASPVSTGSTCAVPLMRVGRHSEAVLMFQARKAGNPGHRIDSMWRVRWNGSTLVTHHLAQTANGTIGMDSLRVVDGVLTAVVWVGAPGVRLEASATLTGTSVEDGTAYSGTVQGTVLEVTGTRDGNPALESLLKALTAAGVVNDRTTPGTRAA